MDRVTSWVEALPGGSARYYLFAAGALILINRVVLEVDGSAMPVPVDAVATIAAVYAVYGFGWYTYLRSVAASAVRDFLPALPAAERDAAALTMALTTTPRPWGWVALAAGTGLMTLDALTSSLAFSFHSRWIYFWMMAQGWIGYCGCLLLIVFAARQLAQVIRLHQRVAAVDLFDLAPLRAFSRLTARAGLAIFFMGAISLVGFPADPMLIAFYVFLTGLGVAMFLLPLVSVRQRIHEEKKLRLKGTSLRLKRLLDEVDQSVDTGDLSRVGDLDKALGVLDKERTILEGISSLPWEPRTLRSFGSSIALPLALWWVKRLLEAWV